MTTAKPPQDTVEERLLRAEATLAALARGEVDVLIGAREPLIVQFQSLAEEKERQGRLLDALVETSPTLILQTDSQRRIVRFNGACERLSGRAREEILGQSISAMFPDLGWPDVAAEMVAANLANAPPPAFPAPQISHWVAKTGEKRLVEWRYTALDSPGGEGHCILGIGLDITEQKSLEGQLRQAQKMEAFGQLAGGVAHDFNNLLSIITGYSELLLCDGVAAEKQRHYLREIKAAGDRAAGLTSQLLAFSRKQILQPVDLNLNLLVADTEKMLRRLIGEDIDLMTGLDPELGRVRADPGQIEQVIVNLAVNARDAMPTGGLLTIDTRNVELDKYYVQTHPECQAGNHVMLAVTDSGCGMDEATRGRVFEPFFTTKEVGKGTGLGLATVHGIVKQSGGSVEVYSEIGHGTTFKIYLPRLSETVESSKSDPGPSFMPPGTETILLAEDEDGVRGLIKIALESIGYTVLTARNGMVAVQMCKEHPGPIHLLVTDVVMPKMSGRELANLVAAMRPNIKILYLSGYTDDAVVRHGVLEAEMAFLQKPLTPTTLAKKVRAVLDQ